MRQARALRTVASLSNKLLLDTRVSLVLSSSYSRLILVLAAASSAQGVKIVTILLLEVFKGLTATLPATIVLSIVVGVLGNFQYLFIFRGSSLYVSYSQGLLYISFQFYPILIVLVISFRVLFYVLILFIRTLLRYRTPALIIKV